MRRCRYWRHQAAEMKTIRLSSTAHSATTSLWRHRAPANRNRKWVRPKTTTSKRTTSSPSRRKDEARRSNRWQKHALPKLKCVLPTSKCTNILFCLCLPVCYFALANKSCVRFLAGSEAVFNVFEIICSLNLLVFYVPSHLSLPFAFCHISPNSTWASTCRTCRVVSKRDVSRALAFWLCRACWTARLDTLDTTSATGSTRRTCRVVSRHDVTSRVEFGLCSALGGWRGLHVDALYK